MGSKVFEVGKTYVYVGEDAGKTIVREVPFHSEAKRESYIPKKITILESIGSHNFFFKAVTDMGKEITVDNDDRERFYEEENA